MSVPWLHDEHVQPINSLLDSPVNEYTQNFVEERNYEELSWSDYINYYQRDWNVETFKYLNKFCQCQKQKSLSKRCNCPINWNWYLYQNNQTQNNPKLLGHSVCDIGNDKFITIGNKVKSDSIHIYEFTKDFKKCKKLKSIGQVPKQRFAHSAEYIPPINSILFFGGFDSQSNYKDARLFNIDTLNWSTLTYNADIEHRAYHATTTRVIYDDKINRNKFELYMFGGQWCNGGPYVYHNDLFRFTFYNGIYDDDGFESLYTKTHSNNDDDSKQNSNSGWFKCEEIQTFGGSKPRQRSQCYLWIRDNELYVFGGCYDTSTLNDLWMLDLNTLIWTEIKYEGIIQAPMMHKIIPQNFRIHPSRKPCYFDKILNKLIVIHYGELSEIQSQYIKYEDSLYEFEERKKHQKNIKIKYKKKLYNIKCCWIFTFDLNKKKWDIIKTKQNEIEENELPFDIPLTRLVRVGHYLVEMGGGYTNRQIQNMNYSKTVKSNYMTNLYCLKIPSSQIITILSWSRERLIWIGHYKENKINGNSLFYKLPKTIILLTVSFVNAIIIKAKYHQYLEYKLNDDNIDKPIQSTETMMGFEQNNELLRFNGNKKGELSPESVLIGNVSLMENPNSNLPLKFNFDHLHYKRSSSIPSPKSIFDDEIVDDVNMKKSKLSKHAAISIIDTNDNNSNIDDDDQNNTKGRELLMGYVDINKQITLNIDNHIIAEGSKNDTSDHENIIYNTKGGVLFMGYTQQTHK